MMTIYFLALELLKKSNKRLKSRCCFLMVAFTICLINNDAYATNLSYYVDTVHRGPVPIFFTENLVKKSGEKLDLNRITRTPLISGTPMFCGKESLKKVSLGLTGQTGVTHVEILNCKNNLGGPNSLHTSNLTEWQGVRNELGFQVFVFRNGKALHEPKLLIEQYPLTELIKHVRSSIIKENSKELQTLGCNLCREIKPPFQPESSCDAIPEDDPCNKYCKAFVRPESCNN